MSWLFPAFWKPSFDRSATAEFFSSDMMFTPWKDLVEPYRLTYVSELFPGNVTRIEVHKQRPLEEWPLLTVY